MRRAWIFISLLLVPALAAQFAFAHPQYAEQTGRSCSYCHINPAGGPQLKAAGQHYKEHRIWENFTPIFILSFGLIATGILLYRRKG